MISEKSGGDKLSKARVKELNDYLSKIGLCELNGSGFSYTWKPGPRKNIVCKLDRTLVNLDWLKNFY